MHAAGILRDVAADRAGDLRGRIGRVVEPVRSSGLGHAQIGHSRLKPRRSSHRINFKDAIHPRAREQYPLRVRCCTPGQPGPRATRDHRDVETVAGEEHLPHVLCVAWQHHHRGALAEYGQSIALVGAQLLVLREHAVCGQHGTQRGGQIRMSHVAILAQPRRAAAPVVAP